MTYWLGIIAMAAFIMLVRRYQLKPIWPALAYGVVFTAILYLTRTGEVSNVVGGVAAVVCAYVAFYIVREMHASVGALGLVFLTFATPAGSVAVANWVGRFIGSLG